MYLHSKQFFLDIKKLICDSVLFIKVQPTIFLIGTIYLIIKIDKAPAFH